jgi:hypothetical protein
MSAPPIPEPRLRKVKNETPFRWFDCDKMGPGRRFFDVVIVKGTFKLTEGLLRLATAQADVSLGDESWDAEVPEHASLRLPGDAILTKPSTDVLVTGTARRAEPLTGWNAGVVVRRQGATLFEHWAAVYGRRAWRHRRAKGWTLDDPEPAIEVPLRYELAYGGAYRKSGRAAEADEAGAGAPPEWIVHQPNPSGTGFFDLDALDVDRDVRAPQWEDHANPVGEMNRDVAVAGFGPIARPWAARAKYAGTYDEAWERGMREDTDRGLPADYPGDFDPRFFQCAHPGLVAPSRMQGDEEISLVGVVAREGPFTMQLPGKRLMARLVDGAGDWQNERLVLDTVHVDLDEEEVYLTWRITLDQSRDIRGAAIVFTAAEDAPIASEAT